MANIMVVYFSDTGNTQKMADLVAAGAQEASEHNVEIVDIRDLLDDMDRFPKADGYALGSPDYFTYMAGEMKILFDRALSQVASLKGKPFVSFVSHGGGGNAIESIDKLAKSIGLECVREGVKCKGSPDKTGEGECRKLGADLAKALGD